MTERDSLLGGAPPPYPSVDPSHNPEHSSASSPPPVKDNTLPPAQQCPQMEFNTAWAGWKDRGFAIAFWIHFILVTILGFVLGVPAVRADAR
ncbi:unnamed protein product, partial [Rotaria magnacalcarata]